MEAFWQVADYLPSRLRKELDRVPEGTLRQVEEIRLRVGRAMALRTWNGEREVASEGSEIGPDDIRTLVERVTGSSAHTYSATLKNGFVTVPGGHRLGLCGTAIVKDGEVAGFRDYTSAAFRVARQWKGAADPVMAWVRDRAGRPRSTLILSPPGAGKTTLLRDLIRQLASKGPEERTPLRVAVADERGEVAALYGGRPQLDVGRRTDVAEGCPKAQGLMLLLRAMNPQVLAVDEITAPEDAAALRTAAGCGVTLLATAHGAGREDLTRRPLYRGLLEEGMFRRLVEITRREGRREYRVEELK